MNTLWLVRNALCTFLSALPLTAGAISFQDIMAGYGAVNAPGAVVAAPCVTSTTKHDPGSNGGSIIYDTTTVNAKRQDMPEKTVISNTDAGRFKLPQRNAMSGSPTPDLTGGLVITQSTSQAIISGNSTYCSLSDGMMHDNSYWRAFDVASVVGSGQFEVNSVSFGVEQATSSSGTQPVTVRLYTTSNFPSGFPGSLILIAEKNIDLPDQVGTIFQTDLTAIVPSGTSQLVMEVFTPDGVAAGNTFLIGSNTDPETGPGYLSAADCQFPTPIDFFSLGFPSLHIVFNVNGSVPLLFLSGAVNISTRLAVGTGDDVLIGGFIITGTSPMNVILRAIGPSLTAVGITDVLADPLLELHLADGTIVTNDNWRDTQEQEIIATGIPPANDLESAIVATLDPGAYTAIVSGRNAGTGVALVEVYDLGSTGQSQLANISTRGLVQTGDDVMIGGFILAGSDASTAVVRAIGPSLTAAGVSGVLQDPILELHNADGTIITTNDNWMDGPDMQTIIDDGLAPTDAKESALLALLTPGAYTAIVSGTNNTTGVALVEVYVLQ